MIEQEIFLQRIMQARPNIDEIVDVSYPITSFGDLNTAKILTVGINPSIDEFHGRSKGRPVLPLGKKRFEDSESLGLHPGTQLSRDQAHRVLSANNEYFHAGHNPYNWFNYLEKYALNPLGVSYHDGSAAHFDLVQWATDPVWSKIENLETREKLINNDIPYLASVLEAGQWDLVILNGKEVYRVMREYKLFQLFELEEPVVSGTKRMFWNGRIGRSPMVCWSVNLPVYGTSVETRVFVSKWVERAMDRVREPDFKAWLESVTPN